MNANPEASNGLVVFAEAPQHFRQSEYGSVRYRIMKGRINPNTSAARRYLEYKIVGSTADYVAESARLERKGDKFFLTYDLDKPFPTTVEVEGDPTPDSVEYQNGYNAAMAPETPKLLTEAKMRKVSEQWRYGYQAGYEDRKSTSNYLFRDDIVSYMNIGQRAEEES